jgi:hypothetical protein
MFAVPFGLVKTPAGRGHRALSTRLHSADSIARQPCLIAKPVAARLLAVLARWYGCRLRRVFIISHPLCQVPPSSGIQLRDWVGSQVPIGWPAGCLESARRAFVVLASAPATNTIALARRVLKRGAACAPGSPPAGIFVMQSRRPSPV